MNPNTPTQTPAPRPLPAEAQIVADFQKAKQIIAKMVKEDRKSRGLTLNDFGPAVGISRATMSRVERCEDGMQLSTFFRLAHAMRISPGDFLWKVERALKASNNND